MPDFLTKEERSLLMSKIRSKNTKPELLLKRTLMSAGIRFRMHAKLPGSPDMWIPSARVAVFVDGDFWHRCPVHAIKRVKKDNNGFWRRKFRANMERDLRVEKQLLAMDILPIRIWEYEVRRRPEIVAEEIRRLCCLFRDKKITLPEMCWLAGFFDGEGTITITKNRARSNRYGDPWICVGNMDIDSCLRFKESLGIGSASKHGHDRGIVRWRTAGSIQAAMFLRWFKCLLSQKRPQAELLSVYASTVTSDYKNGRKTSQATIKERGRIFSKIRLLNKRIDRQTENENRKRNGLSHYVSAQAIKDANQIDPLTRPAEVVGCVEQEMANG